MIKIYNLPENVKEWIVTKEVDGDLWFWGTFDNEEQARVAAINLDGIVIHYSLVD